MALSTTQQRRHAELLRGRDASPAAQAQAEEALAKMEQRGGAEQAAENAADRLAQQMMGDENLNR